MLWLFCLIMLYTAQGQTTKAIASIDVFGTSTGTTYTVEMTVGSQGKTPEERKFRMILDTGSANDAIIAGCCSQNRIAKNTYQCTPPSCSRFATSVQLRYASGAVEGNLIKDTFSTPGLEAVSGATFISIEKQDGFLAGNYEGILGVAYPALSRPADIKPPSLLTTIFSQRQMPKVFGLLLCGTLQTLLQGKNATNFHAGQWLIGGPVGLNNEAYFRGPMYFAPLVQENWYMVTVSDLGIGGQSLQIPCEDLNSPKAIVDSGTTNLKFPTAAYNYFLTIMQTIVLDAIPEFKMEYFAESCCDPALCSPTSKDAAILKLPPITITLAMEEGDSTKKHVTFTIPPEYYWRPSPNRDGSISCRRFGIAEGNSFVLGDVFMDGLYTFHDLDNARIGFALAANCPNEVVSTKTIKYDEISKDWCDCFSQGQKENSVVASLYPQPGKCFFMLWWMYVVAACALVSLISLIVIICMCCRRSRRKSAITLPPARPNRITEPSFLRSSSGIRHRNSSGSRKSAANRDTFASSDSASFYSRNSSVPMIQDSPGSYRNTFDSFYSEASSFDSPITSNYRKNH